MASTAGSAASAGASTTEGGHVGWPEVLPPEPSNWPEWNDADISAEKWDLPKAKPKKEKPKSGSSTSIGDEFRQFEDPEPVLLPASIYPSSTGWKRPEEIFTDKVLKMYDEHKILADLVNPNIHLNESEWMRDLMSSISTLQYIGYTHGFTIEGESPTYCPNTVAWQPWHHVYSMCKAGKGQVHKPQINTLGKYVVRVFYMGVWRKITVDDRLPVDSKDQVLLPGTSTEHVVEMWPYLLVKALLKVAALTWTADREIVDYSTVTCLTGWIFQNVDIAGLDENDIWDMCVAYSSHYTWPEDPSIEDNLSKIDKGSKKSDKTDKSGKKSTAVHNLIPTYLFGICEDLTSVPSDLVLNVTPCFSHSFLIEQTRDIPIENPGEPKKLEPWKHYRWESWAIEKGILPDERKKVPIKCFKMISFFKQVSDSVKQTPPNCEKSLSKSATKIDANESKNAMSDKTGKKGDGDASTTHPDPSIWGDFNELGSHIFRLCIYFKPSVFKTNIKITNLFLNTAPAGKPKGGSAKNPPGKNAPVEELNEPIILRWPHTLVKSRNEPLYIFMDSLDFKFLVVSLSHQSSRISLSEIERMEKRKSLVRKNSAFRSGSRKSILSQTFMNTSGSTRHSVSLQDNYEDKINAMKAVYNKPCENCSIVVEKYDWQSIEIGEMVFTLKSYGISTSMIDLSEGRYILRLWIKSSNNYFLNILSDSAITIGSFDLIAQKMASESHRMLFKIHDISQKFGNFYNSVGRENYRAAKIDFCSCYKPDIKCEIYYKNYIHDVFKDELKHILKQNCIDLIEYNHYLRTLGILFLQPEFPKNSLSNQNLPQSPDELYFFIKYIKQIEKRIELISQDPEKYFESESMCSTVLPMYTPNEAAVKIQALFKQKYIQKIMSYHDRNNKITFKDFKDSILKIYEVLFSLNNRTTHIEMLLRNFVDNPKIQELVPYYTFIKDFSNTICLEEFNGTIEDLKSDSWVFLTRLTFNLSSNDAILLKINLYCNLQTYFLRIFDNDLNLELPRYTNNVLPYVFRRNRSGYTILGYGWTSSNIHYTSTIWKLIIVRIKTKITEQVLNIVQSTFSHEVIVRNYIPNFYNYICRCLIKITHTSLVTVRLQLSYPQAKFVLICKSTTNEILHKVEGKGSLIIPVLFLKSDKQIDDPLEESSSHFSPESKHTKRLSPKALKNSEKSKPKQSMSTTKDLVQKTYVIEAFVLKKSWPLTSTEWDTVEYVKKQELLNNFYCENVVSIPSGDSAHIRFKHRKNADANEHIEQPSWMLEVVSNSNDNVVVERDTTREEEIRTMKQSWEEKEPGRALKAYNYRLKVFETITSHESIYDAALPPINEDKEMSADLSKLSVSRSLKHFSSSATRKRSVRGLEDRSQTSLSSGVSKRNKAHSVTDVPNSRKSSLTVKSASTKDSFIKSMSVFAFNSNENRTLKPVNKFKFSAPLDLSLYERDVVYKDIENIVFDEIGGEVVPEERRWVKSPSTEDILKESRERKMHLSQRRQEFYLVEMERFAIAHVQKFNKLTKWFDEGREVTEQLTINSYSERSISIINYVDACLEEFQMAQPATKKK